MKRLLFTHHRDIHVNFSSYIRIFLDYLAQKVLYNRPQTVITGNYSKVLQYLNDYKTKNLDAPVLPLLSGNFIITGLQENYDTFWRHATRNQIYFASKMYEPLFQDDHVQIIPVFNRIVGTSDVILICHSSPELQDYQLAFMNWFSVDKFFYLPKFETQLLMPTVLTGFTYENEPFNYQYQLDWANTSLNQFLVKSTGQEHLAFPLTIHPLVRLTSVSDGSVWYGSTEMPDFRLNVSFEWEFNIPTFIVLNTDYQVKEIKTQFIINGEIDTGYKFVNPETQRHYDNPDILNIRLGDTIIDKGSVTHTYAFHHVIEMTEDYSVVPDGGYEITLPVPVNNDRVIKIASYWGILSQDYEYQQKDENTIIMRRPLQKGDTITVYYYDPV